MTGMPMMGSMGMGMGMMTSDLMSSMSSGGVGVGSISMGGGVGSIMGIGGGSSQSAISNVIMVQNLPLGIEDEQAKELVSPFGNVCFYLLFYVFFHSCYFTIILALSCI